MSTWLRVMPHHYDGDVRVLRGVHYFEDHIQMADGMPDGKSPFEVLALHIDDQERSAHRNVLLKSGCKVPTTAPKQ